MMTVTDAKVIDTISKRGENGADWEYFDDYVKHPTTKRYRQKGNPKSPIIAVCSGLPMRTKDGSKVNPAFSNGGNE